MSCGIGHRLDSDPELLWLWLWPAATAPIQPLGWEPLYATGAALKKTKKKKKITTNTSETGDHQQTVFSGLMFSHLE